MRRNAINFLYIPDYDVWCLEVVPVAYASNVVPWKNTSVLACYDDVKINHKWGFQPHNGTAICNITAHAMHYEKLNMGKM